MHWSFSGLRSIKMAEIERDKQLASSLFPHQFVITILLPMTLFIRTGSSQETATIILKLLLYIKSIIYLK